MLFDLPALDSQEAEIVGTIEQMRRSLRYQLHQPRRWLGNLRRLSFARAIQGSNSIEGFVAALDDVAAVEAGEEPLDADAETKLALWGCREAMTHVLQLAREEEDFEHSTQLLKSLHFMMTSYDMTARPGLWRAGPIFVHDEDTEEVVYEGPTVELVPPLMRELESDLRDPADQPGLLRGAMAHLNLVMIHPFRDGNGRMARCLQTLVLAREGVLEPEFCSIEEYLGRNTRSYYDVLAEVGQGSWHPEHDPRPWVRFNLKAHYLQAQTLLQRVKESEQLWVALERLTTREGFPDRVIEGLWDAAIGHRVRRATYLRFVSEPISEQAAGRDLRQLAERGILVPHGEKRGRYYTGSKELVGLWRAIRDKRNEGIADPFAA